jgi:uncharacterized protein YndB with AHSA1/START domain
MARQPITAAAIIQAPAQRVYAIIADYRDGHPRILPKPYFVSLTVEQGGSGAGTVVTFQMKVMGSLRTFHSVITEPEPGRVLVETDSSAGSVTTFTVDPREDGQAAFVSITTELQIPDGFFGKMQGWMTTRTLRPIYVKELEQLAVVATAQDA